jgi:hypothetical protein
MHDTTIKIISLNIFFLHVLGPFLGVNTIKLSLCKPWMYIVGEEV